MSIFFSGIKILFLKSTIRDLPLKDLGGNFHYINCVGVLHHLPQPQEGLKTLTSLLTPDGGISLMVVSLFFFLFFFFFFVLFQIKKSLFG